jgi:hypothetical protein
VHAGGATDGDAVRPELLPRPVMSALAEEVKVEIREDLAELIGIDNVAGD